MPEIGQFLASKAMAMVVSPGEPVDQFEDEGTRPSSHRRVTGSEIRQRRGCRSNGETATPEAKGPFEKGPNQPSIAFRDGRFHNGATNRTLDENL